MSSSHHSIPTSSRGGLPRRAGARSLGGLLLLASALGCGGQSREEAVPTGLAACVEPADCEQAHQECRAGVCVERIALNSRPAGAEACSVVRCPAAGTSSCCTSALASATGNARQQYASRLQVLDAVGATDGRVRADFSFDRRDQQGWLTFELHDEMQLSSIEFTGWREGVADRYLSLNTNQLDGGGCAFAFELERRPPPPGSGLPFVLHSEIRLQDDSFCYGGGRPGRASELAFAIFSTQPGSAALVISELMLHEAD